MRILALLNLLAAVTMMHTVHAFPRPDLAVRQDENDFRNESHIFHHLDRNQRTANRDRERHRNDAKRSGIAVAGGLAGRPRRAGATRERRFLKNPDYSEGGGGASLQPASSAGSDTVATPAPGQVEKQPTSAGDH